MKKSLNLSNSKLIIFPEINKNNFISINLSFNKV